MSAKNAAFDLLEQIWNRTPRRLRHRILRASQDNFLVGALGIISNPQSQILLLEHRFRMPAPWGLPGGFLKRNESPTDGLKRELMEETGLEIQLNSEIYETIFDYKAGYLTLVFVGTAEDRPLRLNPEIRSGGFFAPEAVPPEMYAPQLEILHRWLEPDMAARLPKPSDQTSDDLCRT